MAPRKSTARQASATPLKKTSQGANALPDNASITRRSLRSASRVADQANSVHPNLPEVQTQQSYAYGSPKAPLLPEPLRAREQMSTTQLANTIDQQRSEAEHRFRTEAVLPEQPKARTPRTTRRKTTALASPLREGSHDSVPSEVLKSRRTAAWATSLHNDDLRTITEEESELIDEDNTRLDTDPSSFPSGIFDNSYNYERGLRRPRMLANDPNAITAFFGDVGNFASEMAKDVARMSRKAASNMWQSSHMTGGAILRALPYVALIIVGMIGAAIGLTIVFGLFCSIYRQTFCNLSSSSAIQQTLQNICGQCTTAASFLPGDLNPERPADRSFISRVLGDFGNQLKDIEGRLESQVDTKHSTTIEELQRRQRDLEIHISKLERKSASSWSSPSSPENKVNYFAPGSGAIINPIRSSPTLHRPTNFFWRQWQYVTGSTDYISNPPAVALEAWQDLGDCWCSFGEDGVRLDVKMAHWIYPTEITIEHVPTSASPEPGTAPREIEIWSSFRHLSADEYAEKGIWSLVGSNPISPGMGKIGAVAYDARPGVDHVQTFKLDVNQGTMIHSANEVSVKVISNYGADRTCLYRVKLHGQPVIPSRPPIGFNEA